MLVAFSVENYLSFKQQVTLSMVAAEISSKPKELDSNNVFAAHEQLKLLTSAAIYGANASGKSNLVAALRFMRNFVLNSSRETRVRQTISVAPFRLSTETDEAPSRFEVVFIHHQVIYRYGFLVSRNEVEQEWLYATTTRKESYLFERTFNNIKVNERSFKEGRGLEERTRPNALFLSVAAQWNGKRAGQIIDWFEKLTVNTGIGDSRIAQVGRYEADELPADVVAFVRELDLGIEDMRLERQPPREVRFRTSDGTTRTEMMSGSASILTAHTKYNAKGEPAATEFFDLMTHESQGTQRLFVLAEPILAALRTGTVLVIDEIDARLHPILTCAIIGLFNNPDTNSRHAQLIFTTHDTNLLGSELFRRDQIWFIEKSRRGESTLYSLVEYKPAGEGKVRNDAAFEKNYIAGRYGAIPYLGSFIAALGVGDAEQEIIETSIQEETGSYLIDSDVPPAFSGDEG